MTSIIRLQNSTSTFNANLVVASITLSPSSTSLIPGQSVAITPLFFSSGGRPISGEVPDSWTSDNVGVATVDSNGIVTYVGNGTTAVRCNRGAVVSDDLLVICGAVAGGPNEPVSGMTPLRYHQFNEILPAGWINERALGTFAYEVENDTSTPGSQPISPGQPNVGVFNMRAYIWEGTAVGGTSTTIVLDSSASSVNGSYVGNLVSNSNNPTHPYRTVTAYVGATRTATITGWSDGVSPVQPNTWDVVPTNGSVSRIHAMTPGSGGCQIAVSGQPMTFAPTKLYYCGYFRLNAGFQICYDGEVTGSGVQKFVEFNGQTNYYGTQDVYIHCPELLNVSDPKVSSGDISPLGVVINGRNGGVLANVDLVQNENTGLRVVRNSWYRVEALVESSSVGTDDGKVQIWLQRIGTDVSPLRRINYTNQRFETPVGYRTRWLFFNIQNTYGGGGNPITADNKTSLDDFYVSGGYVDPNDEPDVWQITSYSGTTVAAGSDVHIVAQLVDSRGTPQPVNIYGNLPTYSLTNGATKSAWDGAPDFATDLVAQLGRNGQTIHIPGGLTTGQTVVVTCSDYAIVNNDQNGRHRLSNSLVLTIA